MAYDLELAERVEVALRGNLCLGVWQEFLIVRVGAEAYEASLAEPFTEEFDITGRPLTGWVMLEPEGVETSRDLQKWMERGIAFTKTLPAK